MLSLRTTRLLACLSRVPLQRHRATLAAFDTGTRRFSVTRKTASTNGRGAPGSLLLTASRWYFIIATTGFATAFIVRHWLAFRRELNNTNETLRMQCIYHNIPLDSGTLDERASVTSATLVRFFNAAALAFMHALPTREAHDKSLELMHQLHDIHCEELYPLLSNALDEIIAILDDSGDTPSRLDTVIPLKSIMLAKTLLRLHHDVTALSQKKAEDVFEQIAPTEPSAGCALWPAYLELMSLAARGGREAQLIAEDAMDQVHQLLKGDPSVSNAADFESRSIAHMSVDPRPVSRAAKILSSSVRRLRVMIINRSCDIFLASRRGEVSLWERKRLASAFSHAAETGTLNSSGLRQLSLGLEVLALLELRRRWQVFMLHADQLVLDGLRELATLDNSKDKTTVFRIESDVRIWEQRAQQMRKEIVDLASAFGMNLSESDFVSSNFLPQGTEGEAKIEHKTKL